MNILVLFIIGELNSLKDSFLKLKLWEMFDDLEKVLRIKLEPSYFA